jgi:uncharacterized protein (TIGR01777 family)
MGAFKSSRILVSGASGPIGRTLLPSLKSNGARITRLTRNSATPHSTGDEEHISWDPEQTIPPQVVSGFDAVIHLAGETIAGRWTEAKKAKILNSRVVGTRNLAQALAQTREKPGVFVCASAIGYYGNRGDELLREQGSAGTGFLAHVCQQWETATAPAEQAGIRTARTRFGVVLSPKGGALQKMQLPFKLGLGGAIGDGLQWWSWIDVEDLVGAIHHILKTDLLQGPVNVVAPRPVTNAEFTKTLASVLSRPAILPMPAFAVKLLLGQMGEEVLLGSQRVEPSKLISSGYPFRFRELSTSLDRILNP